MNLGDYRRKCSSYDNHSLFSPDNAEGLKIRNAVCEQGLCDAIAFLEEEHAEVVVFDATNTTVERRKLLHQRVVKEKGFKLFFVESVCDDQTIVESNIRSVKVDSPDYVGFTADAVVDDFKKRIAHYQKQVFDVPNVAVHALVLRHSFSTRPSTKIVRAISASSRSSTPVRKLLSSSTKGTFRVGSSTTS